MMKQHHITIYGPGCPRCDELARMTEQATNSLPGAWEIRKEKDPERMAAAGVLSTPGLELDGKLLLIGKVPTLPELQRLLAEGADCRPASAEPSTPCTCSCGGGCACGSPGKPLWKKAVLIFAVLLLIICGIRALNSRHAERPAAPAEAPAMAAVQVVYYTFGTRCPTCVRMEQWAKEAVQQNFSQELSAGRLSFATKEATADIVAAYGLTTKSLLLHRGTEAPVNLVRIWELSKDEAAFKAYVTDEIRRLLKHE